MKNLENNKLPKQKSALESIKKVASKLPLAVAAGVLAACSGTVDLGDKKPINQKSAQSKKSSTSTIQHGATDENPYQVVNREEWSELCPNDDSSQFGVMNAGKHNGEANITFAGSDGLGYMIEIENNTLDSLDNESCNLQTVNLNETVTPSASVQSFSILGNEIFYQLNGGNQAKSAGWPGLNNINDIQYLSYQENFIVLDIDDTTKIMDTSNGSISFWDLKKTTPEGAPSKQTTPHEPKCGLPFPDEKAFYNEATKEMEPGWIGARQISLPTEGGTIEKCLIYAAPSLDELFEAGLQDLQQIPFPLDGEPHDVRTRNIGDKKVIFARDNNDGLWKVLVVPITETQNPEPGPEVVEEDTDVADQTPDVVEQEDVEATSEVIDAVTEPDDGPVLDVMPDTQVMPDTPDVQPDTTDTTMIDINIPEIVGECLSNTNYTETNFDDFIPLELPQNVQFSIDVCETEEGYIVEGAIPTNTDKLKMHVYSGHPNDPAEITLEKVDGQSCQFTYKIPGRNWSVDCKHEVKEHEQQHTFKASTGLEAFGEGTHIRTFEDKNAQTITVELMSRAQVDSDVVDADNALTEADKKLAAAEAAYQVDPSEENQAALDQAQAEYEIALQKLQEFEARQQQIQEIEQKPVDQRTLEEENIMSLLDARLVLNGNEVARLIGDGTFVRDHATGQPMNVVNPDSAPDAITPEFSSFPDQSETDTVPDDGPTAADTTTPDGTAAPDSTTTPNNPPANNDCSGGGESGPMPQSIALAGLAAWLYIRRKKEA